MDTESARFPVATPSGVHNEVENGSALYIALLTLCNFRVKYDVILKCHYSYSRKDDMFKGTPVQQEVPVCTILIIRLNGRSHAAFSGMQAS